MARIDTIARHHYRAPEPPEVHTATTSPGLDIFATTMPTTPEQTLARVLYHLQTTAACLGQDETSLLMLQATITLELGRIALTTDQISDLLHVWAGGAEFASQHELDVALDDLRAMLHA